jgi:hypothetical protein
MKILQLNINEPEKALQCLDDLRKAIENEEIIAFAAVGIEPNDVTRYWQGSTKKITNLRLIGAITALQNFVLNSD